MNKIFSIIALAATALFATACSSEIPDGDASYFNSLPTYDSLITTKNYLPLQHPCMLHTAADISRVKGNLTAMPWKEAYEHRGHRCPARRLPEAYGYKELER